MTTVHYRRQRLAPGVTVSDWTATARCPQCGSHLVTYRMAPERDGYYMVSAERGRDAEDHIAIVRTFVLAKALMIQAAMHAASLCSSCWSRAVASAGADASRSQLLWITGARTHSNTGFLSQYETTALAGTPTSGGRRGGETQRDGNAR